jgi:hypothetical protein
VTRPHSRVPRPVEHQRGPTGVQSTGLPGRSFVADGASTALPLQRLAYWERKPAHGPGSHPTQPVVRGSRRLVLPDQSAQFPQEQHRLTAPWRLLLAGRCGTEAGVRLGRWRLLSGKAWQAGASVK